MMRQATQIVEGRNAARRTESLIQGVGQRQSVPAPVGGWNARDALAAMKPTDAVRLINWFPRPSYVESRGGCSDYATGLAASGKSLMNWSGPSNNKFFVGTSAGIYDVTSTGAVGAVVKACTNGKFQWAQFSVASGEERLIMVNGTDSMIYYNGTTFDSITGVSAPIAVTGVTTSNIIHVNIFKQRLFFIEKNKLSFWYLPIQSLGGAAVEFQMNTLFKLGGFLMAMATWTIDAGDGPEDRAVFISSEGEAAVFVGTDPSSATAWQLVGVYFVGRPIGRRCFTKLGGDIILLVQEGAFPLSQAMLSASIDRTKALTNRVETAFLADTRNFGSVFGWEPLVFKGQGAVIINSPHVEDGLHYQYVMNTRTQRWTLFQGWDAECFGIYNGELYFTTSTKVVKAWTGTGDFGANINFSAKCAFNPFGSDSMKELKSVRPIFGLTGPISFNIGCDVDFDDNSLTGVAAIAVGSAALWDVALWDVGVWTADFVAQKDWRTVACVPGVYFALTLTVATNGVQMQWMANDFVFERSEGAMA